MPNTWESKSLYTHIKVSSISGNPLQVYTPSGVNVKVATDSGSALATIAGLSIPQHDYISMSYSGTNLTGVVYKNGGVNGATLATLALTYDGNNNLLTVTKS